MDLVSLVEKSISRSEFVAPAWECHVIESHILAACR